MHYAKNGGRVRIVRRVIVVINGRINNNNKITLENA
jgi:hypothetical protein